MIEGLKLQIGSDELRKLLESRAEYHGGKAKWAEAESARMEPMMKDQRRRSRDIGKYGNTSSDAAMSLGEQADYHADREVYFKFLASHVIPNETYQFREPDLRDIEVLSRYT